MGPPGAGTGISGRVTVTEQEFHGVLSNATR
jgi:hypothetical protein